MIALWFASVWAKCWKYIAAVGALLLAIGAIFLKGRAAGEKAAKAATAASDAKATAKAQAQVQHVQESRDETDKTVNALPAAPVQTVATADSATAAGQLRDDWLRDPDADGRQD